MKKILISQSNYIPWKGYFDAINTVDTFVIYDDMQYTRRDWRNRNRIKTPQGAQWLTIPVDVKGKFSQRIRDTRVADTSWGQRHWSKIRQNYGRAAWFTKYKDEFAPFYLEPASEFLSDINYSLIKVVCDLLGISTTIRWSSEYSIPEGRTERLVSICLQEGATAYFTGSAAKSYIDESQFRKHSIDVHYLDYSGYPVYQQLYGDFDHSVSILDLIFNTGDSATTYMKSF